MTPFVGRFVGIGLLAGLTLTTQTASADLVAMFFAMPIGIDPAKLFLNTPGQTYTDTNDPNSRTNGPITGTTLLPGIGGLEIHGRFSNDIVGAIPVQELDLFINDPEPMTLTPTTDTRLGTFVPWKATDQGVQGGQHKFVLTPQAGSAPMDQGDYYGVLTATVPQGNTTFQDAAFSFKGFTQATVSTPEPGVGALLLGAVASGGLLALRRRRPGKSGRRGLSN